MFQVQQGQQAKVPRDVSDAEQVVARIAALANSMEGLRNRLYALHEVTFGPEPRATGNELGQPPIPSGFLPVVRGNLEQAEKALADTHNIIQDIEARLRL